LTDRFKNILATIALFVIAMLATSQTLKAPDAYAQQIVAWSIQG
jgi:hypothetical protein